jgi:type II secretory pathway component PulJ
LHIIKDNKGISLLELVIAMVITSIVLSMLLFFINGATNVFKKSNNQVSLQLDAQTTINQISKLAMEAYSMEVYPESSAEPVRFIFEQESGYTAIVYDETRNILYLLEAVTLEAACNDAVDKSLHYLAGNVDDFGITADADKRNVKIGLSLKLGKDSYSINRTVKMRNAS